MQVSVAYDLLAKRRSTRVAVVMDHFGIDFEVGRHVVAEGVEFPIEPGDVVLFTGESGSGKSSLMRRLRDLLQASGPEPCCLDVDELDLGESILVDKIDQPVHGAIGLLTSCGLGEARLMLRTPTELSDGQRYRFRLALAVSRSPAWIVADEFTATLDRTLAKVVAFNVRRLADRKGIGFLLATTHEDATADLAPDLHVQCHLDGEITWTRNTPTPNGRPEVARSRSTTSSNSRPARDATGRTSLPGTTAATDSASCDS